ncbi:MAG: glycosyl hydrolase [Verrucomicrobiota bacterium]
MKSLIVRKLLCVSVAAQGACSEEGSESFGLLEKLEAEPRLLFVGQDLNTIRAYVNSGLFPEPTGVVSYTNIYSLNGIWETDNFGAGDVNALQTHRAWRRAAYMFGLALMETEAYEGAVGDIAKGKFDENIIKFAKVVRDMEVPVFVRIGYEFDGPWYGYSPDTLKAAFRHIVDKIRPIAPNFLSVWHSVAFRNDNVDGSVYEANLGPEWMSWYPGDEYVDWTGITWFNPRYEPIAQQFIELTRKLGKPCMIAESAPMGYDLQDGTFGAIVSQGDFEAGDILEHLNGDEIWNRWHRKILDFIEKNEDVVRSICYINTHWDIQPMWSPDTDTGNYQGLYWGDSRLVWFPRIAERWKEEISRDSWLQIESVDWSPWLRE